MSRSWFLLRFFPAALVVLLAVLWIASTFVFVGYTANYWAVLVEPGQITLQVPGRGAPPGGPEGWMVDLESPFPRFSFGTFRFSTSRVTIGVLPTFTRDDYEFPISFLILVLLPIAIGCVTRFQFRLWMYFVGVALVAVCLLCGSSDHVLCHGKFRRSRELSVFSQECLG